MSLNNDALYLIIDTIDASIFWKDLRGRYLGCNHYMVQMSGFKHREEIIGKTDREMPWWKIADKLEAIDRSVLKNGLFEGEESPLTASSKRVFHTKKTILYDKNKNILGIIGISIDITERKKAELMLKKKQKQLIQEKDKALAANRAKTEFLANMRHDIRTPLSGIVGFSEILKSESNEPRIKEYADNLVASSHALLHLMDEVLDAVKIGSGEIPRLKRKFDLIDTLEQVISLYEAKACERKLKLSLSMDKKVPRYVIGDKIRVHRIVLELIGNALNFTEEGFVTLHVELAKKEHRHLVLRINVTDSGIGIPQDKQQEIYLQFKRLTPSYQGIYKGAGLGLYVVKQFIEELEGEIYVESEPRKGSVFTCLIPLQEPLLDDESGVERARLIPPKPLLTPIPVPSELSTPSPEAAIKHKILVVEDNFIAQTVAKSLLSSLNCQVDIAANGLDAIALCKETEYDLIFMDIGLGEGMDGYEVTQYIRSQINSEHHIPIIALTAHGADESKQRCIESGMDAVLTKPLTQNNAAEVIHSFIPSPLEKPSPNAAITRHDLPDNDEELFHLNQFSLLDEAEALRNCATLDTVRSMLELLHQELPKDLAQMKQAFAEKNFPLVEEIAHKIKGGAMYLGTHRMKYACQYLERYWKAGERTLFSALYQQAITVIEETQTHIDGWLRTH
ncbi:response regulator (plasmid) [Legionella lytica]|uniref:histidine kinase n=1 Tax=Legionella lytica TaxID=96232 RepID=A0ABY4YCS0_9GAMM|nr:response regulator [Legionella lytica]USQ15400.1 response regulator [Legionella lytica]